MCTCLPAFACLECAAMSPMTKPWYGKSWTRTATRTAWPYASSTGPSSDPALSRHAQNYAGADSNVHSQPPIFAFTVEEK
jgi:hypothetical protein